MKNFLNKFKKKSEYKWIVTNASNRSEGDGIRITSTVVTTDNPTLSKVDLDILVDDGAIISIVPVGLEHPEHFYFWKSFRWQSCVFWLYIVLFCTLQEFFKYLAE